MNKINTLCFKLFNCFATILMEKNEEKYYFQKIVDFILDRNSSYVLNKDINICENKNISPCRLCGNLTNNNAILAQEMTIGFRHEFIYISCSRCNSLSINAIPENIFEYYQNYPNLKCEPSNLSFAKTKLFNYCLFNNNKFSKFLLNFENSYSGLKLKSLLNYITSKNNRVLDVGCGNGEFVSHLIELGIKNVLGIDPFLEKSKSVKDVTENKNLFEVEGVYDVIIFNHTFEHMLNPEKVIKKVASLLNKDGVCIIRMPNIESTAFEVFKNHWEGIHAPFHLVLPSSLAMKKLVDSAGLKIVEMRWETLHYLSFYSINRKMGITDFSDLGARKYFSTNNKLKICPPLFRITDYLRIKKIVKRIANANKGDYINYYLKKQ